MNIHSRTDDDVSWKATFPVNFHKARHSTGGMSPRTEWCVNQTGGGGPVLNSKHYKILSKRTLDSIQKLTPRSDRSTASTAPCSNRSSFAETAASTAGGPAVTPAGPMSAPAGPTSFPAVKRMGDLLGQSMSLEGIAEEGAAHKHHPHQQPLDNNGSSSHLQKLFPGMMHNPSLDSFKNSSHSLNVSSDSIASIATVDQAKSSCSDKETPAAVEPEQPAATNALSGKSAKLSSSWGASSKGASSKGVVEAGLQQLHSFLHPHKAEAAGSPNETSGLLDPESVSVRRGRADSRSTVEYNQADGSSELSALDSATAEEQHHSRQPGLKLQRRRSSDSSMQSSVSSATSATQAVRRGSRDSVGDPAEVSSPHTALPPLQEEDGSDKKFRVEPERRRGVAVKCGCVIC